MVVSEAMKPRPDQRAATWLESQAPANCYVSALTIGEISFGIARLPTPGTQRDDLHRWLHAVLIPGFADRIINFDIDAAVAWGELLAASRERGTTLPIIDAQIAAIAKTRKLTLVTRNTRHFAELGIDIIDPWA